MKPTRLILVAVGGQGNLLSSKVIGESALLADIPVRMSEIHGMAQRGGVKVIRVNFCRIGPCRSQENKNSKSLKNCFPIFNYRNL